jgi:hypothetical protein
MEEMGEAPVPPSWPEIWIMSALALATPAAGGSSRGRRGGAAAGWIVSGMEGRIREGRVRKGAMGGM